ncbi:hypothetical protein [Erwinia rhapontici]|uniref:hypothetical protein n=1 Tax=Erwinia rhapontici TaxID=55212 RepID=UPI003B9FB3AD
MTKFIVAFSRLYEVMLAFFLLKLVSDFLTPSEFAKLNLFTAVTQGVALFFISPLQNWILVNNIKARNENWLSPLLMFELIYTIVISLLAFLVFYFMKSSLISVNFLYLAVFVLAVTMPIIAQTVVPIFNINHHSRVFVTLSIFGSSLSFLFPVLFVICLQKEYEVWLLGVYLAQLIVCVISFKMLVSKELFNFDIKTWKLYELPYKQILKFSLPLSVAVGFQWFNSQGFRLQLEAYISLSALGAFIMGFSFGGKFLNAIEKVFSTVLMPALYNRNEQVTVKKAWLSYVSKMSIIYLLSTVVLYVIASGLYKLLIADEYQNGIKYIAAGMLFDMFRCILNSVYQYNMITAKNNLQFIINACMTILIAGVIYIVFTNHLNFYIFVYSMPIIMALVTIVCFFINYVDEYKLENC